MYLVIVEEHNRKVKLHLSISRKRKGNSKSQKKQLKKLQNLHTDPVKLKLSIMLNDVNHGCIIEKD